MKKVSAVVATALLVGCQALPMAPDGPQPESTPAEPEQTAAPAEPARPPLPDVALEPDLLYRLLVAEISGQRGEMGRAAFYFLRTAYETEDPRLAREATRTAVFAQDFALALKASELWVELAPEDLEANQSHAALLIRAGETDAAVTYLERVLAMADKVNGHGFMMVTNLLQREQDRQRALEVMERLIASRRDDPDALYAYARLASVIGSNDKALAILEDLLEREPEWGKALALKGDVLHATGRGDEAVAIYREAVALEPENTKLRLAYARLLVEQQRLEEARDQFRELSRQLPDNANVTYALGLLALRAGDLDKAEEHFGRLLTSGQRTDEAAYSLGQIAEERGRWEEAIKWYSAVDRESGSYLDARIRVAVLLAREQSMEKARRYLDQIDPQGPEGAVRLRLVEGELLRDAGRPGDAIEVYGAALEAFPDNEELLYARAMAAERADRIDLLERDLRRILENDPGNTQALNALGYTLADRTERYQEAYDLIQRAYEVEPDDAAVVDSMGWVLYRLGRLEEAVEHLRRAYELQPDGEIGAHLGEVLWVSGQREEAREVWNDALERFPDHELLNEVVERFTE